MPGLKHVGDLNSVRHTHTTDWQRGQLWGGFDLEVNLLKKIFTVGDAYFVCYTFMCYSKFILMYAIDVCPIKHFICLYTHTHTLLQAVGERKHTHSGGKKKNRLTFVKTFNTTCLPESSMPLTEL